MRRGAASRTSGCSAPGPGRLCQALGVTREHDGLPLDRPPFELRPRRARRSRSSTGPRIGITKAAEPAVALRPRGLALPQPPVRALRRVRTTRIPGAAATPQRGSCATTRAVLAARRSGRRSFSCASLARACGDRQADQPAARRRRPPGRRRADLVVRRERPARAGSGRRRRRAAGRASPACRRRSTSSGWPIRRSCAVVERRAADVRHLDLVRLAVGDRRRRLESGEELERRRARGSGRCRAASLPVAEDHARRRRVREYGGAGTRSCRRRRRYGERLLHERLPDQRRVRAALDRLAVVLGQHRPQLVRVADPDRGHEVGRVADEPGVAVVLGRAGLAGDRRSRGAAPPCRSRTRRRPGAAGRRSPALPSVEHADGRRTCRSSSAVLPSPSIEALDRARLVAEDRAVEAVAAVRERRVRARHLERRRRLGAEADREVRLERRRDPELRRAVSTTFARPDDVRQLREHGVVGVRDRLRQVDRPEVLALVVVDLPQPAAGVDRDRVRDERRRRRDPALGARPRARTA